jgi:predicted dehydrogenase/threonine dehydrogenase-like Zn-dependent dehydrogenase
MKQVLQSLRDGRTEVVDVPTPAARPGHLLIRTRRTLVSAGTERMLVEFGKAGWIGKARQQPEKLRAVLDKIRTDGVAATVESVLNKLDQPLPLGYCNVGSVVVGDPAHGFHPGDRVVSNGKHADVVSVPVNLCARVPAGVDDDTAVFAVLGAVALQGIRLIDPTLGECVVVTGLGLVGLMAVQLLRANGCRVLALDFDDRKLAVARTFGAETFDLSSGIDPGVAAREFSRGRGVDAVLVTATTDSDEPIRQAAEMSRKRGRIVLVGQVGMHLSRALFYEKELSFRVSCSYGPGRHDPSYEARGVDYPVGYVRWTEQRNFEAVLDMMAAGVLSTSTLISHRFAIADAAAAYELLTDAAAPSLGIVIDYGAAAEPPPQAARTVLVTAPGRPVRHGGPVVGFIGSGSYATGTLIPAFKTGGARLKTVVSREGVSAVSAARRHAFEAASSDVATILQDDEIDVVVVATRHDSHAELVAQALAAGKHVYVEKPLATDDSQVQAVVEAYRASRGDGTGPVLGVGLNRRFSSLIGRVTDLIGPIREPKALVMTVNAGAIPADHWIHDPAEGGGRIIGECCHFVDLLRHLAASPLQAYEVTLAPLKTQDTLTTTLQFADGTIATLHYFANGNRAFPKERLEVFAAGRVLVVDNFRSLRGYGWSGFRRHGLWRQDKGQVACVMAFLDAVAGRREHHIPIAELEEVARLCIGIARMADGSVRAGGAAR